MSKMSDPPAAEAPSPDLEALRSKLLELTQQALQGNNFDADKFYAGLSAAGPSDSVSQVFVDVLWLLWIQLEGAATKRIKLVEIIKTCIADKKLDRKRAMDSLDVECMQAVNLVPDIEAWKKKEVRYNTRTLYLQSKYNLLREDSEGYAKALTALNHFGDAALQPGAVPALMSELQALVGFFDLDPNRLLDLILEAYEAQPHNSSYLALIEHFKTEAIVHFLGFKLSAYQAASGPAARRELYLISAALIQRGLVNLEALLGHLSPTDDALKAGAALTSEQLKADVEAIGQMNLTGGAAAPAGAAALPGVPTTASMTLSAHANEASGTGRSRADAGTRNPALTSAAAAAGSTAATAAGAVGAAGGLGAMVATETAPLSFMSSPAQQQTVATGVQGVLLAGAAPTRVQPALPSAVMQDAQRRSQAAKDLQLLPEAFMSRMACEIVADNHNQKLALLEALLAVGDWEHATALSQRLVMLGVQPVAHQPVAHVLCEALAQEARPLYTAMYPHGVLGGSRADAAMARAPPAPPISPRVWELMTTLGMYLSCNAKLLPMMARILRHHFNMYGTADENASEQEKSKAAAEQAKVVDAIINVILPALSLMPGNIPDAAEVWTLLNVLPYTSRFHCYAEFRELQEGTAVLLAAARIVVQETKKLLKRLILPPDRRDRKELCRPHARILAKVSAANPLPALETLVVQLESYDNQIEPVIEALRMVGPLSVDMLTYVILTRLSMERKKLKADGINISDWLQSLALFTGAVCRKQSGMEISALSQFLANALLNGDSFDLLVLKELVTQMTNIKLKQDMSDAQLEGCSGGPLLASEALVDGVARDGRDKSWARGARRLMEALQKGPSSDHSALPLLVLLAQQRSIIIVHTESKHVKFLAEMYDKCQETLLQYIQFLKTALSFEDYAKLLPPFDVLAQQYISDPEIAFLIYRPILAKLLADSTPVPPEDGELEEGEQAAAADGSVDAQVASGADQPAPAVTSMVGVEKVPVDDRAWRESLTAVQRSVPDPAVWRGMSVHLYTLFWTLSLNDIYVPSKRYESEIEELRAQIKQLDHRIQMTRTQDEQLMELREQRARMKDLLDQLPAEQLAQQQHADRVIHRINLDKSLYFANVEDRRQTHVRMMQDLIVRRMFLTPMDALYSSRFAFLLTHLSVPNFSMVWYLNQVLIHITGLLPSLTDSEAGNMGIFLADTLRAVSRWHASPQVFKEECLSKPGFATQVAAEKTSKRTEHNVYKRLCSRWHQGLASAFKMCLDSEEYTARRNALTVLNRIVLVYPSIEHTARLFKGLAETIRDKDMREDLRIFARSYVAALGLELSKEGRMTSAADYAGPEASLQGKAKAAAAAKEGAGATVAAEVAATTSSAAAPGASKAGAALNSSAPASKPSGANLNNKPPNRPSGTVAKSADAAMEDERSSKRQRTSTTTLQAGTAAGPVAASPTAASGAVPTSRPQAKRSAHPDLNDDSTAAPMSSKRRRQEEQEAVPEAAADHNVTGTPVLAAATITPLEASPKSSTGVDAAAAGGGEDGSGGVGTERESSRRSTKERHDKGSGAKERHPKSKHREAEARGGEVPPAEAAALEAVPAGEAMLVTREAKEREGRGKECKDTKSKEKSRSKSKDSRREGREVKGKEGTGPGAEKVHSEGRKEEGVGSGAHVNGSAAALPLLGAGGNRKGTDDGARWPADRHEVRGEKRSYYNASTTDGPASGPDDRDKRDVRAGDNSKERIKARRGGEPVMSVTDGRRDSSLERRDSHGVGERERSSRADAAPPSERDRAQGSTPPSGSNGVDRAVSQPDTRRTLDVEREQDKLSSGVEKRDSLRQDNDEASAAPSVLQRLSTRLEPSAPSSRLGRQERRSDEHRKAPHR